jgi:type IV secretory pathway VirD2 relaxase
MCSVRFGKPSNWPAAADERKEQSAESSSRLRPRKPWRGPSNDPKIWAGVYVFLTTAARLARKARRPSLSKRPSRRLDLFQQRVAVRITYAKNKSDGQWRAHGRYVGREAASHSRQVGFDRTNDDSLDIGRKLDEWQRANDERMWKVIVSPEFGERVDLRRLTRELLVRMEADLGTPLEWVAAAHFNTGHPHVHVALRGVRDDGCPLLLERDYIKSDIRHHAEELATQQLGARTPLDVQEAQRREISVARYTFLDRLIARENHRDSPSSSFTITPKASGMFPEIYLVERLRNLERMGLAEGMGRDSWEVKSDLERVLRSMQRAADRQRTIADHGLPVSDKRLPFQSLDFRTVNVLEGRVLVHGEEEGSGRHYFMLEATDATIYFVPYTAALELARARRLMRPGSFIALQKEFENGKPTLKVKDLGDAEALLKNKRHFEGKAKRIMRRVLLPYQDWEGWLGRYHAAIREAMNERQREHEGRNRGH